MRLRFLLILAWFGAMPLRAEEPAPLPLRPPDAFQATVGGFKAPTCTVELRGDGLHYEVRTSREVLKTAVVHPTAEAWSRFLRRMNEIRLSRWAPSYSSLALDGTWWKLTLRSGDRTIASQGSNNYPEAGREAQPGRIYPASTEVFDRFCAAVSDLVGRPFP